MKESENIDDIFSNALDNFGVEPPTNLQDAIAETRNNIEPEDGNNNKNYFLIIIAAMAIVFAALFFTSNEEQKLADAKDELKTKNELENNAIAINTAETINNSNESRSEATKHENIQDNSGVINKDSVTKNETGTNENTVKTLVSINKANDAKNSTTHSETIVDEYVKPLVTKNTKTVYSTLPKKTRQRKVKSLQINNNRDSIFQEPMQKESENSEPKSNNKFGIPNSVTTKIIGAEISQVEKSIKETIANFGSDSLQNLNKNVETTIAKATVETVNSNASAKNPLSISDSTKTWKKLVWFIEPLAGIYTAQNKFSNTNTISVNQLKDSIKILQPTYNYGVNVGVQKNRFTLKSGLAIQQWKEQLGYSYSSQNLVTAIGDSIIINGTDTVVKHNIPVEVLTNVHSANNTKITNTYLQIPFFVGYSFPLKKLDLNVGLGFVFNQLLKSKGNYMDFTKNKLIDYSTKKDSPLNNSFISSQLSLGAAYQINRKLKVCLYLPYNLGLQSIYKNSYIVNRKVNAVGLQLGIRYEL